MYVKWPLWILLRVAVPPTPCCLISPSPVRGTMVCELSVLSLNQPRHPQHPEVKKQMPPAAFHLPRMSPLKP